MPTYDYVCRSCEHEFEAFQSMSARPMKKCPACGKMQLKRLIGAGAGIIFKGSGFYETDYRSSEYKQKASQESQSSTGSSDGSDSGGGDGTSTNSSKGDSAGNSGNAGGGEKTDTPSTGKASGSAGSSE